jgi:hypothetical protein
VRPSRYHDRVLECSSGVVSWRGNMDVKIESDGDEPRSMDAPWADLQALAARQNEHSPRGFCASAHVSPGDEIRV